jgi:hypothetical protein
VLDRVLARVSELEFCAHDPEGFAMRISTRPGQLLCKFCYQAAQVLAQDVSCSACGGQPRPGRDCPGEGHRLAGRARLPVRLLRRPGPGLHRDTRLTRPPVGAGKPLPGSWQTTVITGCDRPSVSLASRTAVRRGRTFAASRRAAVADRTDLRSWLARSCVLTECLASGRPRPHSGTYRSLRRRSRARRRDRPVHSSPARLRRADCCL